MSGDSTSSERNSSDDLESNLDENAVQRGVAGASQLDDKVPNDPLLFRLVMSASLLFDLITGIIGLVTLIKEKIIECCGDEIQIPPFFLWISVAQVILVIVEIFPVIFKFIHWVTFVNPFLGLIITAGLIYNSNRAEAIAVLCFEIAAVAMSWCTLKFIEGRSFCCSVHVITILPTLLTLLIVVNYLTQEGECVTSDQFQSDENNKFSFSIKRSDGTEDCKLCLADGLPWNTSCASNSGNTLGDYYGTYCGAEKQFCWFPN